jgi:hypothetical protein
MLSKKVDQEVIEKTLNDIDVKMNESQHLQNSPLEDEDDAKFIRYVWNKVTKRLERKDVRDLNVTSVDLVKF